MIVWWWCWHDRRTSSRSVNDSGSLNRTAKGTIHQSLSCGCRTAELLCAPSEGGVQRATSQDQDRGSCLALYRQTESEPQPAISILLVWTLSSNPQFSQHSFWNWVFWPLEERKDNYDSSYRSVKKVFCHRSGHELRRPRRVNGSRRSTLFWASGIARETPSILFCSASFWRRPRITFLVTLRSTWRKSTWRRSTRRKSWTGSSSSRGA